MRRRSLNKYINALRHTCPLYIYELMLQIIIAVNPYRPTIKELQLLRRRVLYNTTIYLRYAARERLGRAICMSGDDERRHAQRLILVLPSCPSSSDMAL